MQQTYESDQHGLEQLLADVVYCRLFVAPPAPNLSSSLLADFFEANYDGYNGPLPITWGTVGVNGEGRAYSLSAALAFAAANVGSQTVYGWYLTNATGDRIYGLNVFDPPLLIDTGPAPDSFRIVYTYREDPL